METPSPELEFALAASVSDLERGLPRGGLRPGGSTLPHRCPSLPCLSQQSARSGARPNLSPSVNQAGAEVRTVASKLSFFRGKGRLLRACLGWQAPKHRGGQVLSGSVAHLRPP